MSVTDCRKTLEMSPFWGDIPKEEQAALIRSLSLYYPDFFSHNLIGLEVTS